MEYKEFSAKTVEEAITEATLFYGVTSKEITYEILEKGSAGLFGIGSKDAVIKAAIKSEEEELPKELTDEFTASFERKEESVSSVSSSEASAEGTSVNEEVKKETAEKKTFEAKERVPVDEAAVIAAANEFLTDLFKAMDIDVTIDCAFDAAENFLNIDLKGPEMGIIIGKRGQTLDSVQYLTNLAVNRKSTGYVRVKIDTEDYRRRRKDTLENLAHNVAHKVKKTHKTEKLEPMNPYERRVIHAALANLDYVETHSEGEEPYRYVVVSPKK